MLTFENYINHINKPTITFLIGPPASGKSTWIKNNILPGDAIIISRDDILYDFIKNTDMSYSDSFYDTELQDKVNDELEYHIVKTLQSNKNIVVDMTNIDKSRRNYILSRVPENYIKNAVVFEVSVFELIRRLEKREKETGKHIKKGVVSNLISLYEKPSSEDFDNITYYKE